MPTNYDARDVVALRSLLAVLAQRLVRKVCEKCGKDQPLTAEIAQQLGINPNDSENRIFRTGEGCDACRDTGYRGRIAVSELLIVDESIRDQIQAHASAAEIRETAQQRGMQLLRDDGIDKITGGITTPEEVNRVTVRSKL